MKKLISNVFLIMLASMLVVSCDKDESLDPRPVLVSGQFIKFDITSKIFNFVDINNTKFGGLLTTPGNKVKNYKLYVRMSDAVNPANDFTLIKEISTFPTDLYFTPQDIATTLGIPLSDIKKGNTFEFYGVTFDEAGKRVDLSNLSAVVRANSTAYKHGYRFVTAIEDTSNYRAIDFEVINNWEGI